ncbi:MAG: AAA family ATPase [Planctomycetota bacterium]
MLTDLTIRNLALIEEARLAFGEGLNAITGETGAGKSLLVSSLQLLSGERLKRGAASGCVREGAERAEVEGRFLLADPRVAARVAECLERELPAFVPEWHEEQDEGERELLLARTVDSGGRSRAWINHRPVTRRALAAVAGVLFEIHGQHSHQRLLEPAHQVAWLDSFARATIDSFAAVEAEHAAARGRWRRAERRLREHCLQEAERRERIEVVRYRLDELNALECTAEEPAQLVAERQRLRHGSELGREASAWLDGISEGDGASLDRLRSIEREVDRWIERVESLEGVRAELEASRIHLEEATATLLSFAEDLEHDPGRLEWVEGRLAEYERLSKIHAVAPEALVEQARSLEEELERLCAAEDGADSLRGECASARAALALAVEALDAGRGAAAEPLAESVMKALRGLGLRKARLGVAFEAASASTSLAATQRGTDATANGSGTGGAADSAADADGVVVVPAGLEFCFAANPGEPMHPLREVASGGEVARLVLALRSALAGCEDPRSIVLDEIDTGVGGRLGPALGQHLRGLGEHHQVLTVTHLPAIAASAHSHQVVRKAVRRGRTRTAVALLEGDERVMEVADMIAGGARAATAQAEARRLLGVAAG